MEFWLMQDNEKLQLPVPPNGFEVGTGTDISTINVENIGEVSFIGNKKLKSLSMEGFFPSKDYSFVQYKGFPEPYECVKLIEKWEDSKKPIRCLITGTSVNTEFTIENFSHSEEGGSGDVNFSIELKEYRRIVLETKTIVTTSAAPKATTTAKRPVTKVIPKTYTVKSGDTLRIIAKRLYGNGDKWRTLYEKNKSKIKNPNMIYPGQVLLI